MEKPGRGPSVQALCQDGSGSCRTGGRWRHGRFFIRYENGKFRLSAKAGFCLGVGARGKLDFEVDGSLVLEFAKWVYHQLKNINYRRLFFIDDDAFHALSNIILMSVAFGNELKDNMLARADDIAEDVGNFFVSISEQSAAAEQREI